MNLAAPDLIVHSIDEGYSHIPFLVEFSHNVGRTIPTPCPTWELDVLADAAKINFFVPWTIEPSGYRAELRMRLNGVTVCFAVIFRLCFSLNCFSSDIHVPTTASVD